MASFAGSSVSLKPVCQSPAHISVSSKSYGMKPSISFLRIKEPSFQSSPLRLRFSCGAKPSTIEKVSEIVKQQLALVVGTAITSETKFTELGADSLDTVEIVMSFEQEFNVTVEEENAQNIITIGDAADLIEELQTE